MKLSSLSGIALLAVACGGNNEPNSAPYLRSDDPNLAPRWALEMPVFRGEHQNEQAVVQALALDASTRALIEGYDNRVRYTTPTGSVEIFYDEGFDKPFHSLHYQRSTPCGNPPPVSNGQVQQQWQGSLGLAVNYLTQFTRLTPVVQVGAGTSVDYQKALDEGFEFHLAVQDHLLAVDDLSARVDEQGLCEFSTDELAFDAIATGLIPVRTEAQVEALLIQGAFNADIPVPPPIVYGFDATDTQSITPYYLATKISGEGGVFAIPLDPNQTK